MILYIWKRYAKTFGQNQNCYLLQEKPSNSRRLTPDQMQGWTSRQGGSGTPWTRRFSTFESFMTGIKATVGPLTKCFRNTRLKRNEHITAGSWKWRKAHLHPSFSPLAEAWGKRLKLSIRESQHSYQTKGEHPIVIRFLTYAENSASQSSAQPSPPSEDTEEEQSNGATTRTTTSTSYQDGLVICVDIMFIFSNCIVYNNFTL